MGASIAVLAVEVASRGGVNDSPSHLGAPVGLPMPCSG